MTTLLPAPAPAPSRSTPRVFRPAYEPPPEPVEGRGGDVAERPYGVGGAPPRPERDEHGLPGAGTAITGLLRMLVEVFDGRRPPTHLAPHVAPGPLGYWKAVTERRLAAPRPARRSPAGQARPPAGRTPTGFGRVHRCHPRPEVAEVALCLHHDDAVSALAARFEADRTGRWRCTVLRLY